jgi:hypothetical protein
VATFTCNIDERDQDAGDAPVGVATGESYVASCESLARAVIDARENLALGFTEYCMRREWMHRLSFLAFACEHPSRRKRTPMDVEKMVNDWLPLIRKLATCHDIDERDAASSQLDEYLTPIIAAPVVQIREFYRELVRRMKADPSVPWAVWKLFEFWGTNVLDKIEKEEVIGLKTELAKRIAENSFAKIPREDWIASMVGALQWRHPEKLEQIDNALKAGHKPRVRGKESCLFLAVGESEVML